MVTVIQILAEIIAGLFILCGLTPLMLYGHLNSGNAALVLYGILAMGLAVFWDKLGHRRSVAVIRNIGAGFLAVCFLCAFIISCLMLRFGYFNTPDKAAEGTVVVLGCEIHGESPSSILAARLNAAVDYLKANPDTPAIVSGGTGKDELYSEAHVMKKYLIEHGIEEFRIYCEDRSADTAQNIAYSKKLLEEHGLPDRMLIATDGFHEFRAFLYARQNGLTAQALPVRDFTPSTLLVQPEYWVREILGVLHLVFLE